MGAIPFKKAIVTCIALNGNAYAYIERKGQLAKSLTLLDPSRVKKYLDYNEQEKQYYGVYEVRGRERTIYIPEEDMLHFMWFTGDGHIGVSPIESGQNIIGLSLAMQQFSGSLFGNGVIPSGIVQHPGKLDDSTRQALRTEIDKIHRGAENAHKLILLQEGMTYQPLTISSEQTQLLEARKWGLQEVCRLFGVPPSKLGYMADATLNNAENSEIVWVRDTIRPLIEGIEAEINRKLFSDAEWNKRFIEFNLDSLLRGDKTSRMNAYKIGTDIGLYCRNDIAEKENEPIYPWGERYFYPLNMGVYGDNAAEGAAAGAAPGAAPGAQATPAAAAAPAGAPVADGTPATDETISRLPITDLVGSLVHPTDLAQAIANGIITKETAILQLVVQLGWSEEQARAWADSLPSDLRQANEALQQQLASLHSTAKQTALMAYQQTLDRFKTKEINAITRLVGKDNWKEGVSNFYSKHKAQVEEATRPYEEILRDLDIQIADIQQFLESTEKTLLEIEEPTIEQINTILEETNEQQA